MGEWRYSSLHTFLNLALDGGEWQLHALATLLLGKSSQIGSRADLEVVVRKKIPFSAPSRNHTLVVQPKAQSLYWLSNLSSYTSSVWSFDIFISEALKQTYCHSCLIHIHITVSLRLFSAYVLTVHIPVSAPCDKIPSQGLVYS